MPVIVIAESGSTKTEWRVCSQRQLVHSFRSIGLNPTTFTPEQFRHHLAQIFTEHLHSYKADQIYFYGAGLRDPAQRQLLFSILRSFTPSTMVVIEDDLLAAVHAARRSSGIIGILGTGSNASRYENQVIVERRGGHGYLLGDEGSGMDLGKSVLKALLQQDFSTKVHQEWIELLGKDPETLRGEVYLSSRPQSELGVITQKLPSMLHHQEVEQLVLDRFELFLSSTICRFKDFDRYPIDFVGSVAFYFHHILKISLQQKGLQSGKFISHPIEELVKQYIDA